MFPTPREVDRYLYGGEYIMLQKIIVSFRPLARLIGIYTKMALQGKDKQVMFPAPPEVDRGLY